MYNGNALHVTEKKITKSFQFSALASWWMSYFLFVFFQVRLDIRTPQDIVIYRENFEEEDGNRLGFYMHTFQFPESPMFGNWSIVGYYGKDVCILRILPQIRSFVFSYMQGSNLEKSCKRNVLISFSND